MSNHEDDMPMPRSKKQKICESGDVYVEALGGPMYNEATARKILRDAPVVPVDSEREGEGEGEGETGFNPDDVALNDVYHQLNEDEITPMLYFAYQGDLKLMRYLIFRGASTTKLIGDHTSPIHMAAWAGCLDICKFLNANGAQNHMRLTNIHGWTPFLCAANGGSDQVVRWLVLQGALCDDNNSDEVDGDLIHHRRHSTYVKRSVFKTCKRLVDWSKDFLQAHFALVTFLLGTLPPPPDKDRDCILQCLSGHPGIRKNMADFVGLEVTKQLRILQSVVEVLPETMRIGRKDES